MIKFLDRFSKHYGENRVLGETFCRAVIGMTFPTSVSNYPMLRVAALATNMIPNKQDDGVARVLTKTDLTVITNKDNTLKTNAAEGKGSRSAVSSRRANQDGLVQKQRRKQ
jgi:hypothetical protein